MPQDKKPGLLCLSFADVCIFPKCNGNKDIYNEWLMYTLLFELIDFFKCNISLECFLFANLTFTCLLSVVLLYPWGRWWQPLISAGFIMLEFLQIFITLFSRSSSGILLEISDISTLFLLLYCSALACNFSRLMIQFPRLTLTFLTITNSPVIFSLAAVTWLRLSVSFSDYKDLWHNCQK